MPSSAGPRITRQAVAQSVTAGRARRWVRGGAVGAEYVTLCGPPGMTVSVRRALHQLDADDADIREETLAL